MSVYVPLKFFECLLETSSPKEGAVPVESSVTCRLKAEIVEPEETEFARQRLSKYVLMAKYTLRYKRKSVGLGVFYAVATYQTLDV